MGEIVGSKVKENGNIIFNIEVNQEEALNLKGHIQKIRLFSENAIDLEANLTQRGKNGATKYFLVPTSLRKNLRLNNNILCQRIDTKQKIFYIYELDKY